MSAVEPNILDLVNSTTLQQATALAAQFAAAQPFKHVVIDHFLEPGYCQALMDEFPAFDEKLAINEDGFVGAKAVREKISDIGPAFRRLDELSKSQAFLDLVGHITGIEGLHHDPYYFGGGTHENRQTQGLDAHVDFNFHPITREHRRLNLIVYLNPEWRDEWGGSLQLHRDPYLPPSQDEIRTITPLANRCVIFETNEISWHSFPRIVLPEDKQHLSRRSFALYYYTADRPAEEAAAEHSTIYVNEHLPEWYHAGMQLQGDQLQHIRNLIAARDQHLRRLYGHIKNQNNQIRDLHYRISCLEVPETAVPAVDPSAEASDTDLQLAQLHTQLKNARQRATELEQSTSWRITAPLRAIRRLFL